MRRVGHCRLLQRLRAFLQFPAICTHRFQAQPSISTLKRAIGRRHNNSPSYFFASLRSTAGFVVTVRTVYVSLSLRNVGMRDGG